MNVPGKRRNGLHAACEPCRKVKIRCDRAVPACSRCRKRETISNCVYLESPDTKVRSPVVRTLSANSATNVILPLKSPVIAAEAEGSPGKMTVESDTEGFLGQTSFEATMIQPDASERTEKVAAVYDDMVVPDPKADFGVSLLLNFPDEEIAMALLDWYLANHREKEFHIRKVSLNRFFQAYRKQLSKPLRHSNLLAMSRQISKKGREQLANHDDAMEWIGSFSGPNTRWEMIGIFFVAFAYSVLSLPDERLKLMFGRSIDRMGLVEKYKSLAESCIQLCRHSLNNIVCALLHSNMLLESVLRGDASLSVWRLLNDLVGTAVAYGLHCYDDYGKITFCSEATKKMSACIFWAAKVLALFTGRPPLLSHRYLSCSAPLDLDDEVLLAGGERLVQAISELNKNGSSRSGKRTDATLTRTMFWDSMILDEIMEVFLGNQDQWDLDRVLKTKEKVRKAYFEFAQESEAYGVPGRGSIVKAKVLNSPASTNLTKTWGILCSRLDFLRINFLLERLLTERGGKPKNNLFAVAEECLDLTVFVWLERERWASRRHDFDYILLCYGMPAIGVLCTELVRQFKHPRDVEIKLNTSQIIQHLSLMVGFLDWIKPSAGNYKICQRMSQVIGRVLDQVLLPDPGIEEEMPSTSPEPKPIAGDWPMEYMDDMDWLNSVDWTQPSYLNWDSSR